MSAKHQADPANLAAAARTRANSDPQRPSVAAMVTLGDDRYCPVLRISLADLIILYRACGGEISNILISLDLYNVFGRGRPEAEAYGTGRFRQSLTDALLAIYSVQVGKTHAPGIRTRRDEGALTSRCKR
jgi:hypothetical protein